VRALRARGKTILYTSHYMEEVQAVGDRAAIMDRGRLLCCGTLGELLAGAEGLLRVCVSKPLIRPARAELERAAGLLPAPANNNGADENGDGGADSAGRLVFAVRDADGVADALAALRRHGARVVSAHYGVSNLEDVFLRLTRRALRD
jgi:ABC-2 type transport system ATP-binding protein